MKAVVGISSLVAVGSASSQLCGTNNGSFGKLAGFCEASGVFGGDSVSWTECCPNENFNIDGQCRSYTFKNPYCMNLSDQDCVIPGTNPPAPINTCDKLDENDILTIDLEFVASGIDEGECCKDCSCYGDPECVSFDGTPDLWIPCDGRVDDVSNENDCKINRQVCTSLMGPNGKQCKWDNANGHHGDDWATGSWIKIDGSPCVPDLSEAVQMTMFKSKTDAVSLDLGERGVIDKTFIVMGKDTYSLQAAPCLEATGTATGWFKNGVAITTGQLPAGITRSKVSNDLIFWDVINLDTGVATTVQCLRIGNKAFNGKARLNVKILAPDATSSGGFCSSGTISEKNGDHSHNKLLHERCTTAMASASQACKALVSEFNSIAGLEQCGQEFCVTAYPTNSKNRKSCMRGIGNGESDKGWLKQYCLAVARAYATNPMLNPVNGPSSLKDCMNLVDAEGYYVAGESWGKGHSYPQPPTDGSNCGKNIDQYKIGKNTDTCVPGVFIDTMAHGSTTWKASYFVPSTEPFCNNKLVVNAVQARSLFDSKIQIRQCQGNESDGCKARSDICNAAPAVNFKITFENMVKTITTRLLEQFEQENLACKYKKGETDSLWCLKGLDYNPPGNMCPCPTQRLLR